MTRGRKRPPGEPPPTLVPEVAPGSECCRCGGNIRLRTHTPSGEVACQPCIDRICKVAKDMAAEIGRRDGHYQRTYGISSRAYRTMFEEQMGACAICRRPQEAMSRLMVVDHNHETGAVRGLLCGSCNTGLGLFSDSNRVLLSAIAYLTERGSAPTAHRPVPMKPTRIQNAIERRIAARAQRPPTPDAPEFGPIPASAPATRHRVKPAAGMEWTPEQIAERAAARAAKRAERRAA